MADGAALQDGNFEARRLWAKVLAGQRLPLAEVGFLLGISAARVEQIERRALARLRAGLKRLDGSADDLPQD